MVRMFTSAIEKRISDLREMEEKNQREVLGVSKDILRARIQEYTNEINGIDPVEREALEIQIANQRAMVLRAQGRWEDSAMFDERTGDVRVDENGNRLEDSELREQYELAARRLGELEVQLAEYDANAEARKLDPNSDEYHRRADVIPELQDLLDKSNPDLEYIPLREIQKRLRNYRAQRDALLAKQNGEQGDDQDRGQDDDQNGGQGGTNGRTAEQIDAEIETLRGQLQASAERMAELRRNGNYDLEAGEHTYYNELVQRIADLEKEKEELNKNPRTVEDVDNDIAALEAQLQASAARLEELRRNGNYDLEAGEHSYYNELVQRIADLRNERAALDRENNEGKPEQGKDEKPEVLFEDYMETSNPETERARIAQELGIDPSELEISWTGADGVISDDGVVTPYQIVRVRVRPEPEPTPDPEPTPTPDPDPKPGLTDAEKEELRRLNNLIAELEELEKLAERFRTQGKGPRVVTPTEPPITPTEPPITPTDPPITPTDPPITPTEPPITPTEPPITPTEPPITPTEPPVTPIPGDEIEIPEDPNHKPELDEEKIKAEYSRRRDDMYAKYYGDRDYREEYDERADRFFDHEVEVEDENGLVYKTIEDYEERAQDEAFLLLDKYKDALERMSKYEAGETSVYQGTPEQIAAQLAADKTYVETRNHTFDQHEYTQRDLATLGKYGEKMPYIPKQDNLFKNIFRGALNVGIFARNVVAPVYRVIGKYVAQPIHRAIMNGRDGSPYRNNFYHRMLARRDYFADQARQEDDAETLRRIQEAPEEEKDNVKRVSHPVKNWFTSRFNAIFKSKEGNEAVLRAGAHDIQTNIIDQAKQQSILTALGKNRDELYGQIYDLEQALAANPNAKNAEQVRAAIEAKKEAAKEYQAKIDMYQDKVAGTKQTDAVSDKQHAVASKEVNTLRTTVIKGVVKGVAAKYIGPAIHDWVLKHSKIKSQEWVEPTTEQEWVEATSEQRWVEGTTEMQEVTKDVVVSKMDEASLEEALTIDNIMAQTKDTSASYAYDNVGNIANRGTEIDIFRGAAYRGPDGRVYSISDGNGFDIAGRTREAFPADLLTSSGNIDGSTNMLEVVALLRRQAGENVTAQELMAEITSLPTLAEQQAKIEEIFTGIDFWQSTVGRGMPTGWNSGLEEVLDAMNGASLSDIIVGTEKVLEEVVKPGYWDTVIIPGHWDTITTPGYWKDVLIDNPRVVGLLNGGKVVARGALVADGIHDVAENLRNTHTDIPSNKTTPRHYEFDNGELGDMPTSKLEYERYRKGEIEVEEIVTDDEEVIDDVEHDDGDER